MNYTLMNAEHEVLGFEVDGCGQTGVTEILDGFTYAPLHFARPAGDMRALNIDLNTFLRRRTIELTRGDASAVFAAAGVSDGLALSLRSMGLSLADRYWYRPAGSGLKWADVSCFDREFDTGFGEAVLKRDYAALAKADPLTPDCTLGGVSRKAWIRLDGAPMLLKAEEGTSSFITQSELLSARLTERLLDRGDYVAYTKVDFAGESYIACHSMVGDGEEFVPAHDVLCAMDFTAADSFKYISKDGELLAQFTKALTQLGVDNVDAYFAKIAAVFDLSLAGDCHLQNFGFIRDLNTMRLRVAPLFDRGRSFGSFGKPLENGKFSCAEYAIGSARTMFVMMLFHSILIRSDWDFGWYDPARLEGFEDEMDSMLAVCADIPKEYIEILKEAFRYQLDYLNKAAEKA